MKTRIVINERYNGNKEYTCQVLKPKNIAAVKSFILTLFTFPLLFVSYWFLIVPIILMLSIYFEEILNFEDVSTYDTIEEAKNKLDLYHKENISKIESIKNEYLKRKLSKIKSTTCLKYP